MKKYLLLRENRQSGPYSEEELCAKGLRPLDLVWIEGRSTSWEYPTEIVHLREFVKEEVKPRVPEQKTRPSGPAVFVALPADASEKKQEWRQEYAAFQANKIPEWSQEAGVDQESEKAETELLAPGRKKTVWQRRFSMPVNDAGNIAAVFMGVILGAFVIKKAVDGSATRPVEESTVATVIIDKPAPAPDKNIRNALATEIVPVAAEKPLSKPKLKDIKKQVVLKGGDYKVRLFGGISSFNLTVVNSSPHFIDKISVAVKYLKKNGEVIETEFFDVTGLRPGSSKQIGIPEKNRGMKVEYKIVNVSSQQYKAALKQV